MPNVRRRLDRGFVVRVVAVAVSPMGRLPRMSDVFEPRADPPGPEGALTNRWSRVLPIVALSVAVIVVGAILANAGSTLGADAKAYLGAARRFMEGRPLYDLSYTATGPPELFGYPPPFAFVALPFALLPAPFDVLAWTATLVAAFAAGVALLPVRRDVRWVIVLLAGLSWPFAYALKLGQVEPILFLVFAAGWRWRDRPGRLGGAIAVGTIVKLQPAILLGWAVLTGRRRTVAVAGAVLLALAVGVSLLVGLPTWVDWVTLLRQISAPVTAAHSFTPGATVFQAGAGEGVATAVQLVSTVSALALVVWAALRLGSEASYLTAVVASQLVSPILWDHYAMLLLLPTAWLLERGRRWAVAIPLATSIFMIWAPPGVYPLSFWAAMLATLAVGWLERDGPSRASGPVADTAT